MSSTIRLRAVEPHDTPSRLRTLPSWLLSQSANVGHRFVSSALAAHDLRKHHFNALLALDELGAVNQADLGRRMSLDRSYVTAVIADLETRGAVARDSDPADARRKVVRLTPKGAALLAELETSVAHAQDALLSGLDAAQRRQLQELLTLVVGRPDEPHRHIAAGGMEPG